MITRNLGSLPPKGNPFSQKVLAVYERGLDNYDYKILTFLERFPFGPVEAWYDENFIKQETPDAWYSLPYELPNISPDEIGLEIKYHDKVVADIGEVLGVPSEDPIPERKPLTEDELNGLLKTLAEPAKLGGGDEPKVIEIP